MLLATGLLFGVLFALAGTLRYWEAWLDLAVLLVPVIVVSATPCR